MNMEIKEWIEHKKHVLDSMIERYSSDDPEINPLIKKVCVDHLPLLKNLAQDYKKEKSIVTLIENHLKDAGVI